MILGTLFATNAAAQQRSTAEVSLLFWRPAASLVLSSDAAGAPGTRIDLPTDLAVADRVFASIAAAVRPAARHRLSFEYIPIRYRATSTLQRDVVFSGATYARGVAVSSTLSWDAFNIGYEYDFLMRPRATLGAIVEAKGTIVEQRLVSGSADRLRRTSVPAPAIGLALRGAVAPRVILYTDFRGFAVPDRQNGHYGGRYVDVDGGGAIRIAPHLSARAGIRWLNIRHLGESDSARMSLPGGYIGLTVSR